MRRRVKVPVEGQSHNRPIKLRIRTVVRVTLAKAQHLVDFDFRPERFAQNQELIVPTKLVLPHLRAVPFWVTKVLLTIIDQYRFSVFHHNFPVFHHGLRVFDSQESHNFLVFRQLIRSKVPEILEVSSTRSGPRKRVKKTVSICKHGFNAPLEIAAQLLEALRFVLFRS